MNYIGSKYSLLDFLKETIDDVVKSKDHNYIFADLFAGTGIVGSVFKKMGSSVIANDIQYYSYILNKHLIGNTEPVDEHLLSYLNSLPGSEGFIYKNYCKGSGSQRNYFSDENGKKCDAIRRELEKLYKGKKISDSAYYYFLASLINSIDKVANTASVYGAFLKKIKKSAQKELTLELLPVIPGKSGQVYNEDINLLISRISGDVLYLDPPYNARQYCANYHVLETIAKYDSPALCGKTGMREYTAQRSRYCSKRQVCSAFFDIISRANFKYIFLSYNNEGLMSLETIKDIMSHYGKYTLFSKNYRRFKADKDENRTINASYTIEYLHCLEKNIDAKL